MNRKNLFLGVLFAGTLLSAADIHYPVNADSAVKFAAQDMARCLSSVTGTTYKSKALNKACQGDIILAVNPKLSDQEWQFTAKEGKLYIEGCDAPGIVYGVYTFLEKYAKCSWLAPDTEILPKQPGWKIPAVSEKGRPAFLRREMYVGDDYMESVWRLRNKENKRAAYINYDYGGPADCHTFDHYIKHIKDPKLFKRVKNGSPGHAICMTDPKVRKIVLDALLKQIAKDRNPKRPRYTWPKIYDISQPDGPSGFECWCDGCRTLAERETRAGYEGESCYSGPNLDFVNYLAREVGKKYPDVFVCTFAYGYTRVPPKTIKAEKNMVIRFCSGNIFDSLIPGMRDEKILEMWHNHTPNLSIWSYWRTYSGALFPQVKKRSDIEKEIRLCKKHNVIFYFAEDEQPLSRSFSVMQHYLMLKMLDDPSQDIFQLADKFMAGYYGKAASMMKQVLDYLEKRQNKDRTFLDKEFFEKVNGWLDQAEKAASGDKRSLRHIHGERIVIDRAMYDQLGSLQKSGYKYDNKAVAARFSANGQEVINAWEGFRWQRAVKAQKLANIKSEGELFSHFPVKIPEQFAGCDVVDLQWSQLKPSGGGQNVSKIEYVKDPDAVCGTAFFNSKLDPKAPFSIGYYNSKIKRGGSIGFSAADIPQDGKYHLYKLGRDLIMTPLYIRYDDTWHTRTWHSTIGIIPEERDIWVSMKFSGPRFVPGSKEPNRVLFDRVLFVKDPNPMRHYKPVDPSKNLLKNGGFEKSSASGTPAGWACSPRSLKVDYKVKHSGKASMAVGNVPNSFAAVWFSLGNISNLKHDLLIRGYCKYSGIPVQKPFLGLWTLTKQGRNSYTLPVMEFYNGDYDWQRFEKIISIEDFKRAALRSNPQTENVSLRLNLYKQPGTVWIDDLEVIPLEKKQR